MRLTSLNCSIRLTNVLRQINCTGQRPLSEVLSNLSPSSISSTGHIKIKPTLQIADDSLPNVYACGDVADTNTPNPNARSAMRQATIVAENILLAVAGQTPRHIYDNAWADGAIKLTLGLVRCPLPIVFCVGYSLCTNGIFPGSFTHEPWRWHIGSPLCDQRKGRSSHVCHVLVASGGEAFRGRIHGCSSSRDRGGCQQSIRKYMTFGRSYNTRG